MRTSLLILLASTFLGLATADAQQSTLRPVASVKQIMLAMTIPSSDVLLNVAWEPPKDEKAWTAVENSAVMLLESGNLLMMGDRAKDKTQWLMMARAMVDAGVVALKAAQSKNLDALFDAGSQIYDTCEACHDRYMDKSEKTQERPTPTR